MALAQPSNEIFLNSPNTAITNLRLCWHRRNLRRFWPRLCSTLNHPIRVKCRNIFVRKIYLPGKFLVWRISLSRRQASVRFRVSRTLKSEILDKATGKTLARRRKVYIAVYLPIDRFCEPHSQCYPHARRARNCVMMRFCNAERGFPIHVRCFEEFTRLA